MVIDENKRRHEREEFMHPRYARVRIFALVRKNKGFMTVCQSDFFVSQVMCRDRKFESLFRQLRRVAFFIVVPPRKSSSTPLFGVQSERCENPVFL